MAEDITPLDWLDPKDLLRAQARLATSIREQMRKSSATRRRLIAQAKGQAVDGRAPSPAQQRRAAAMVRVLWPDIRL